MLDPRQQFRVLYRDFLARLIDLEIMSVGSDPAGLFSQVAALLGAGSLVLAIYLVPRYPLSTLPPEKLALAAWGDQEFLIATTMAMAGMFAVIAWHEVFPNRLDLAVLGVLPVGARTMFQAKLAAIGTGLGMGIILVNVFTGLSYPFALPSRFGAIGALRTFGAYWITMAAAGAFVFCTSLAVQGLTAQFLSYRLFLRISSFLQIAVFFTVLSLYFLTPSASELSITDANSQAFLGLFPSFWFLGLFQELNGPVHPVFNWLAVRAAIALSISVSLALTTYGLAYFRTTRRILEQPDIVPGNRAHAPARMMARLIHKLAPGPLEGAIVLFTARTLARSRRHRTILAAYAGIGFALALTYSKILVYGNSQVYASMRGVITVPPWYQPNTPLMAAGAVIIFFCIVGTRVVYSLPATLPANWVFRITAVHRPESYFAAVRKSLYILTAIPIWLAAAALYLLIWTPAGALPHLLVLALAMIVVVERSLYAFRKVPFACSYLPGKADLTRKLAIFAILFLLVTDLGTRIESWSFSSRSRYIVLIAILLALALRARARRAAFAAAPYRRIQFEDLMPPEVSPLDLRRDAAWTPEHYIDAVDPSPEPSWPERFRRGCRKAAIITVTVAAIGAIYEQYGQWQHRRQFPRIGHSVNIGGRSLNISCSGQPGPTVVFESGAGGPGYGWVFLQREVARFTRACWYDRAGYGWSDSGPYPRDSAAVARDLHALLHAAGVPAPYVLVGASLGGFHVRVYTAMYPEDVAGLVLVDSSHVDDGEPIVLPPSILPYAQMGIAKVLRQVGFLRMFMDSGPGTPPKGMTVDEWSIASSFEPRTFAENAKELFLKSALDARAAGGLGGLPLIVLTAGLPSMEAHNPVEAREALARQRRWVAIQGQLARRSTRGKQVVVPNSRHCIQCEAPDAIIHAVREVVEAARNAPASDS